MRASRTSPPVSRELGFGHLIAVHGHLGITEVQRQRFAELYTEALDESGMPDEEELHPLREVHRWGWRGEE